MLKGAAIAVLLACALLLPDNARSQEHFPQIPRIKTQQKPESTTEGQQKPDAHEQPTPASIAPNPQVIAGARNAPSESETHESDDKGTEFWPSLYGYRLKIADTLLVAFTFGLFIATWHLFRATKRLTIGAEQTAERQLRAYVGIVSGHLDIKLVDGVLTPIATIRIKNFGQTPAYEVSCAAAITNAIVFTESLTNRYIPIRGKNAIFPQSDQRIMFGGEFNTPPGEETIYTFVFGHITYKDAFRNERRTNFRFTAMSTDPSVMGGPREMRADLAPCEEGNEAT